MARKMVERTDKLLLTKQTIKHKNKTNNGTGLLYPRQK